jgi:valyl-tRNA synthetase
MKHVKLFEQFTEELNNVNLDALHEEIEALEEGSVKQILGWVFFPAFSLVNVVYQLARKKKKIKAMIADETDPAKKQALKDKLEALKYEEVKQTEKIKDQEEELKAKAKEAKKSLSPEEKKKLAKEKEKAQKKLDKAKEKLRKMKDSSVGSGFV